MPFESLAAIGTALLPSLLGSAGVTVPSALAAAGPTLGTIAAGAGGVADTALISSLLAPSGGTGTPGAAALPPSPQLPPIMPLGNTSSGMGRNDLILQRLLSGLSQAY